MPIFNFKTWLRQSQQTPQGFLLIETAVSLGVTALLFGSIVLMLGEAMYHLRYEQARVRIYMDAREQLARLILRDAFVAGESLIKAKDYELSLRMSRDDLHARYHHVCGQVRWRGGISTFYTGFYK